MQKYVDLCVWICLFGYTLAKLAPSYIVPCPELSPECLKKTIEEAIPEFVKGNSLLGLPSLDPMTRDRVDVELPGGFKVELHDGNVTGLRHCKVENAQFESNVADLMLRCNITIRGKYKANGRILIVVINGDGDAKIKVSNIVLHAKIRFHDQVRDGKLYYEIKDYSVKHRWGDHVSFALTNLFKGNPQISEAVLTFLNANWRQIAEEFGAPAVKAIVDIAFETIRDFFKLVPKNELFV